MPVPNLALWEEVEKTDPKFTKEYTGPGGFTGTAVNAQYLAKRATEKFGPCGTGWGYDVIERAEDKIEAKERLAAEYREWLAETLYLIGTAQSLNELQQLYKSAMRKLDLRQNDPEREAHKIKFTRAKDARKADLEDAMEGAA